MKLKDLKIGTQLRLGLGVIMALVLVLGGVAYYQAQSLWEETQGLYEHPLAVRRALGGLQADILIMQREMRDLVLAKDETGRQQTIRNIDAHEGDAYRWLALIKDRYLGPQKDVDDVYRVLDQWKALRQEDIRLVRAGQAGQAAERIHSTGVCGLHGEQIMKEINHVDDFALARGDRFYQDAREHKDKMVTRLGMLVAFLLLLSLIISYFLLKGINEPLEDLTSASDRFRQGNLETRSRYVSANEFGSLAASFNNLAETVQNEMQAKENAGRIAAVLLREDELHSFCRELLRALLDHTGSQAGAVYLLNAQKNEFEHFESIGLTSGARPSFSAREAEGEFGPVLADRLIRRITEIPADTRLSFPAVTGDFIPREIITIPILSGPEVAAVISLAAVRDYEPAAIRLVHDVWSMLNARLNGVLLFRQIQEFSEKLEHQNRELEAQKKELAVQADELGEQNIELEMQKNRLEEAGRLKNAFLSNMSHELRTPLNSVIVLSGVLRRRLRGSIPEDDFGYLEVIERNGQNLLALINNLLDLSRIESGREEVSLSRFSFKELTEEVVAMIEPQAREKKIALRNSVAKDLPPLQSDYVKCRHIFQNLVANAVKFTDEGQVEIEAEAAGDGLRITVTDTGIGILEDQIPFIFDEFRQVDDSLSRKYGGSGLGLAIAKKYAMLLGGAIAVKSTAGKGSTFSVRLPWTAPGHAESGEPAGRYSQPDLSETAEAYPTGEGPLILVVEDSEPAVIQLTEMLTGQGYRVRTARNGKEALEEIGITMPAGVILDLMMPEVDGFQVLKTIRGEERTARLPVLILTAKHITREELNFLKGNHVQQLIQKGDISKTDLLTAVGKMVSPPQEAPPPPTREPARKPPAWPVILVVEDNFDNRTTVKALLQDIGEAVEAADGPTALELARRRRPDLILLDISLPGKDGFEILDSLKQEVPLREVPVVALTARVMKGDRDEILARGFDGYIPKPIDEAFFKKTLREFLHGS